MVVLIIVMWLLSKLTFSNHTKLQYSKTDTYDSVISACDVYWCVRWVFQEAKADDEAEKGKVEV